MRFELDEIVSIYIELFELRINQITDLLLEGNAIRTSIAKQRKTR